MSYQRVIPRDLFNEAKLLKCYGQLSLLIHDGKAGRDLKLHLMPPIGYDGFYVVQNPMRGWLCCANLQLMFLGVLIPVGCPVNRQTPYPMLFVAADEGEYDMFNDDGSFSDEFKHCIKLGG